MKMKIKITDEKKLNKILNAVQARSHTRMIEISDITDAIEEVEKKLSMILAKKDWQNQKIFVNCHAQDFANSYKGQPFSTNFEITRGSNAWFVTELCRQGCGKKRHFFMTIEEKRQAMVDYICRTKLNV